MDKVMIGIFLMHIKINAKVFKVKGSIEVHCNPGCSQWHRWRLLDAWLG
jgi:hypothetical protein